MTDLGSAVCIVNKEVPMADERSDSPTDEREPGGMPRWRDIKGVLAILLVAGIGAVGGCISGTNFGGNYAEDFTFLGQVGYEGTALMAGMVCGASLLVIAGFALGLLRNKGAAAFAMIGSLAGVLFGPSSLFAVIAPSVGLLALTYIGFAVLGAAIGMGLGLLLWGEPTN